MLIDKAAIVATLRTRGSTERADWVDRQLPTIVDTSQNASLLRMLGLDPEKIARQPSAEHLEVVSS